MHQVKCSTSNNIQAKQSAQHDALVQRFQCRAGLPPTGAGHMSSPSCSTSAPRTASSAWSTWNAPCCLLVKGPIDSRNLVRLLL